MSWADHALCIEHPEIQWLPKRGRGAQPPDARANLAAARAVCEQCPVTAQCLSEALGNWDTVGIWAGTIDADRRRLRRASA